MANVSSVTKHFITAQEGFTTTLASTISSGAATVPLNSVSGYTNGDAVAFVIEPTEASKKQVFTGTIDTAGVQVTGVVWTEGTNQTHNAGVTVVDYWTATHQAAMVKGMKVSHDDDGSLKTGAVDVTAVLADAIVTRPKLASTFAQEVKDGWLTGDLPAVSSVTNNGNRSYDVVFDSTVASTLTPNMRLRFDRTVTAPTQCTDLESSSTQYWNDTTVSGITFTDDFVCGAWIKLESYAAMSIISRYNGTSGWSLELNSSGQVILLGYNGGSSNVSQVFTYQSLPLGRWVHIAAQLDMSAFTATTTTSYIMIDGVDVPCSVFRGGTNPTALVQAGNLEVGSRNAGTQPFDGKLAQVFVSSAKITQANIRTLISQGLTSSLISTHSIASAYSFDGNANDLNTTSANNLTAQNSANATNADSPFGIDSTGTAGVYDFGLVTKVSTTTATVQVPEGCTIPTSGGVDSVDYATSGSPLGFTTDKGRWEITSSYRGTNTTGSVASTATITQVPGHQLIAPTGQGELDFEGLGNVTHAGATFLGQIIALSTSSSAYSSQDLTARGGQVSASLTENAQRFILPPTRINSSTATTYYGVTSATQNNSTMYTLGGSGYPFIIRWTPAGI